MQTAEDAQAHTTATTQQHSYQQGSVASAATAVGNPLAHAPTPTSTTGAHATHYPSAAHPCDPPCPTPAVSAAAPPSGTTAAAASSVVDNAAADTQPPEPPSPSFLAAQLLSQASPPGTGSAYLLSYERQLVQEMIEEDALCIMSTGMGWQKVRRRSGAQALGVHLLCLRPCGTCPLITCLPQPSRRPLISDSHVITSLPTSLTTASPLLKASSVLAAPSHRWWRCCCACMRTVSPAWC